MVLLHRNILKRESKQIPVTKLGTLSDIIAWLSTGSIDAVMDD